MEIKKKNIFITGSTKGIGLEIARSLDQLGGNIILNGRHRPDDKLLDSFINPVTFLEFDVTDSKKCNKVLSEFLKVNAIDILINNAGIVKDKLFAFMEEEEFLNVVDSNLHSLYFITRPIYKQMIKNKAGVIINMSSVVAEMGHIGQTNYATSKSGILGFTKTLSLEAARYNIRVNAIAPGMIETDMTHNISERNRKKILDEIPLKRFGNTQDIAKTTVFLIKNNFITGQTITVDGGMSV